MKPSRPRSLNRVLLRVLMVRLFLPLLILTLVGLGVLGYLMRQSQQASQRQSVQAEAGHIVEYLENAQQDLSVLALVAAEATPEELARAMRATRAVRGYFDTVYQLDGQGGVLQLTPYDARYRGLDMSQQPYFDIDASLVSQPFISPRTGQPTVYMLVPVIAADGRRTGLMVGELNLGELQKAATGEGKAPSDQVIFVTDSFGTLLAHPRFEWVAQQANLSDWKIIRRAQTDPVTMTYVDGGTLVMGSAAVIEPTGWVVVAQTPLSAIYGPFVETLGAIFVASLVTWGILAWHLRQNLNRHVADPLARLGRGADALAGGDYAQSSTLLAIPTPFVQVSRLTNAFQQMSEAVQSRQAALQKSEEWMRAIFEGVQDAIFVETLTGDILDVNQRACEMFGYSRDEFLTKTVADLVPPDSFALLPGESPQPEMPGQPMETVNLRADGTPIPVEITGRLQSIGDETIMLVVVRDVTERKKAETEIARLAAVAEQAEVAIVITDLDANIVYANPFFSRVTGYSASEAVGQNPRILKSGHHDETFYRELWDTLTTGHTWKGRFVNKHKDGSLYYEHAVIFPVRDASGEIINYAAVKQDITSQVQAEEERARLAGQIREQAQQMRQIVDTAPTGVLLLDADRRVALANPDARQALAALIGETIGEPLTRLGPLSLDDLLARHADPLPVEIALDGALPRIFEAQARPVGDVDPRPWVLTLREVTEERRQQRQFQAQERLATVGQLAAGIAHDFNNIMASIVLYAAMMLRDLELPAKVHERLKIIHKQGHRAAHLVQQILDFARQSVIERQPLDLLPFVKELEKLLERTLPENIRLTVKYGHDDYFVNADPTRIQQAVMNLALNARDAMPAGGDLSFGFSRFRLEPGEVAPFLDMPAGDWVQLDVSDTGTGISTDVLPHIFEPFFTTKDVGKGTGLGLAQVYGIVTQHEGFIGVQSQEGAGTTFEIYLPALPAPNVTPESLDQVALAFGGGEKILVVEDDVIARAAIAEILRDLDYQVITAAHGQEALEKFGPDVALVVSDLVMPRMGGGDLYSALRAEHPDVKMIVITGYPMDDSGRALLERGITAWIKKPFMPEDLAKVVRAALE